MARAVVSATGALDGHLISITLTVGSSVSTLSLQSDLLGGVDFPLDTGGAGGQVTATASVVDPASGQVRTDTETFTITAATSDIEPNNDPASASTLGADLTARGTLDGVSDRQDVYKIETDLEGTLTLQFTAPEGGPADNSTLIVRNASGQELSRLALSGSLSGTLSLQVPAGAAFVTVESSAPGSSRFPVSSRKRMLPCLHCLPWVARRAPSSRSMVRVSAHV